ncbi:MAG: deoxyribose-phosphate aldolase [Verrucomicrobiales bacterium]
MSPLELIPFLDLTTLGSTDTPKEVKALATRALHPLEHQPQLHCAALCIWPTFAPIAAPLLREHPVALACVASAFPHGQAPLAVKTTEIQAAVAAGADEIDIVINRGQLLSGDLETLRTELLAMRQASGKAHLKTILETCELADETLIRTGCRLALECGTDFLKTSTGKGFHGATLEHTRILLEEARNWHALHGKLIGVKPAGGIRTWLEAQSYLELAKELLPEFGPHTFRIGASSLLDDLIAQA